MVSYVPKKNKAVVPLSTMHHDEFIDEDDAKKRLEIIKFHNQTKIDVDLVDQMVQTYTCKRQTLRWPLVLFYKLLDIAALNASTIFRQVHPDCQSGQGSRRRYFITDLATNLILPHMMTRQKTSTPQSHKRGYGEIWIIFPKCIAATNKHAAEEETILLVPTCKG